MTDKSRVPRKLSLAGAYRRVAAKFRRGDHRPSEDYLRYERYADDDGQARLMREERAGEQMREFGGAVFDRLDRPAAQMMSVPGWERAPLTWARSEDSNLQPFDP